MKTNSLSFVASRVAALVAGAWLVTGIVSPTLADEEETRLTQPILEPIPDELDQDEEPQYSVEATREDRANIFGMTVFDAGEHRAIVRDVAIGTPAAKAGIREGDEIISFAGFRGDSYEEWLDGVAQIVRDTPDGETVPIVIQRGQRRMTIRVRTPVASPVAGSIASGRPLINVPDVGPAAVSQSSRVAQQPGVFAPGVSDDDFFINNSNFFGDDALQGRPNERAIAHLYRIPASQPAPPRPAAGAGPAPNEPAADVGTAIEASRSDVRQSSAGGFGQGRGAASARIGLAGFRNREQGMLVMVDVGMLPAGNYTVAIADPGSLPADISAPTGLPVQGAQPGQQPTQQPTDQTPVLDDVDDAGLPSAPVERNFQPAPRRRQPAGVRGEEQQRLQEPLRQQLDQLDRDATQRTKLADPTTGDVISPTAPEIGQVDPLPTTDLGQGDPAAAQVTGQIAPNILLPVGALTIDRSGTGRLQQVVEGVQVADMVGQALVIFADIVPPEKTIPPGGNVVDTATPQPGTAPPGGAFGGAAQSQPPLPVAAGLIRFVSTPETSAPASAAEPIQPPADTADSARPLVR